MGPSDHFHKLSVKHVLNSQFKVFVKWYFYSTKLLLKIPGVPAVAGAAPGRTRHPPGLECFAATAAAMVELHTDCFHIISQLCNASHKYQDSYSYIG